MIRRARSRLETRYEHFPEARWRRRVDRDGSGRTLADRTGTLDRRNRYRRFGDVSFTHDAAGNVTRRGTDNPGFCLYTYDADNRLVKTECFDKALRPDQADRVLLRRARPTRTEGLHRSERHGHRDHVCLGGDGAARGVRERRARAHLRIRSCHRPAQLSVVKDGSRTDYAFVHDGRGQASGLVPVLDPNAFAERYGHEITGASFMKEIDGKAIDFPSRGAARSAFLNAVLSDNALGGLRDWETGTLAGFGGTHIPQDIAEILNSLTALTGKPRKGLVGVLNDQMTGSLNWLGLGSSHTPPASDGPEGLGRGITSKTVAGDSEQSGGSVKTASATDGGIFNATGFGVTDTLVSETGFPFVIHGSKKSNSPDMPFKPDWTLYGMHDGKLDDDDDPAAAPGGQGTSGNGKGAAGGDKGGATGGDKGGDKPSDAPKKDPPLTPTETGGGGAHRHEKTSPAPARPRGPER